MLEQNDNLALNEDDQVGGYVDVEVWRMSKHGPVLIKKERSHNLVTNVGKKYIWRRMANNDATNTAPIFDHFRVGSGSAAATSGGTGLVTPVAASLQTVDTKTFSSGRTFQWMMSYAVGDLSAAAIKEVVLYNKQTSPGGSAAMRCVFATVTMTLADKLKITYSARCT
jgi:hypothetical protein